MKLLLKHSQTPGRLLKVRFKLWGQTEFEGDEREVLDKYKLDDAVLIAMDQPSLIRNSAIIGLAVAASIYGLTWIAWLAIVLGGGAAFYVYQQKRETVYVKDLIHGRYFSCDSVIDLARRERWLDMNVKVLRQVMEASRHWDDTEVTPIPVLDKENARQLVAQL